MKGTYAMEKGTAIEKFVKYMLITNKSLATIETYERDVRLFLLAVDQINQVQEITREIIEEYLKSLAAGQLKSSVIKKKYASLRAFFKFLAEQAIIAENPLAKPMRIPRNLTAQKIKIKKEEAEKILAQVLADERLSARDQLIVSLVLAAGVSLVQLAAYSVQDADKIKLNQTIAVDLRQKIARLLEEHLKITKGERLFLNGKQQPLTYKYMRQVINPYLTQIKPGDKADNFYLELEAGN